MRTLFLACLLLMAESVGAYECKVDGTLCDTSWSYPSIPVVAEPITTVHSDGFSCGDAMCSYAGQVSVDGYLKIDKASFDAMLKDYPGAKLRVMLVNHHCLTSMEEAMRQVDYYVDPKSKEPQLDILNALQTWVNVRRECWSKP